MKDEVEPYKGQQPMVFPVAEPMVTDTENKLNPNIIIGKCDNIYNLSL